MRALRVVGLELDGTLVCECTSDGERFTLPADDTLLAAAKGEFTPVRRPAGPTKTEPETHMRPREIQARIRAGESVEQVAAVAGMTAEKVDRFAYPVLLERSRTAELAQRAHPVRSDGPDVRSLGEVVAATFALRGQDYSSAVWDSWRGEDGKWIVQLQWHAGRSENRAHWTYHPGAHGGTVTTLDDHALDLIDPDAGISLRTIRPVTPLAEQALRVDDAPHRVGRGERVAPERAAPERPAERVAGERTNERAAGQPAQRGVDRVAERVADRTPDRAAERAADRGADRAGERAADRPGAERVQAERADRAEPQQEQLALDDTTADEPAEQPTPQKATGTTEASPNRRGKRPIVPSWEDVLLGVRSNR